MKHLPLEKETVAPLTDVKIILPETFDGNVGWFEGKVNLKLSPDTVPVQLDPRAVPQNIEPKLKEELDKMEMEIVIRACPEATDWVHNLVMASKGMVTEVHLDPRNLNKHLV